MHLKMRLKSIAQVAWECGRKFHKRLKQEIPELNNMFEEYTKLPMVKKKTQESGYLQCNLPGLPDSHFIPVKITSLKTWINSIYPNSKCRQLSG